MGKHIIGNGILSALVSLIVGAAIVISGWWQIQAQIAVQIEARVAPVEKKVDDVGEQVLENTKLGYQNNGMLRAISERLLVPTPPDKPPPPDDTVGQ